MQVHVGAKKLIIIHLLRAEVWLKCVFPDSQNLFQSTVFNYYFTETTHKHFGKDKSLFENSQDKLCMVKVGHYKQNILEKFLLKKADG